MSTTIEQNFMPSWIDLPQLEYVVMTPYSEAFLMEARRACRKTDKQLTRALNVV